MWVRDVMPYLWFPKECSSLCLVTQHEGLPQKTSIFSYTRQQVTKKPVRWAGHVAHNVRRRGPYRVSVGRPKERRPLEDLGVDGRIVQRIFKKWDEGYGVDWSGSGQGLATNYCECLNEHSGSVKREQFVYRPRTCWLLSTDAAPRSLVATSWV
jgi:hypothetical protein